MRLFAGFGGPRRLVSLSVLCASLILAGCMADEDVAATGSPFSQALFKDYTDLTTQAAGAPAPQAAENGGFFGTAVSTDASGELLRLKDDYDGAEPSGNSGARNSGIAAVNRSRYPGSTA